MGEIWGLTGSALVWVGRALATLFPAMLAAAAVWIAIGRWKV